MEKTGILRKMKGMRVRFWRVPAILTPFAGLWFVCLAPALAGMNLAALDTLSVADQYRQLNLALMVSEGTNEAFVQQLLPGPAGAANGQADTMPLLNVEDFQTPLNRIVDQGAMITQAAHAFRFVLANREAIEKALAEMAASRGAELAEVDLVQLAEDAIIVRSALSGSIEYMARDDPAMAKNLETYQNSTLYLRNVMEYWKFDKELAAITDDAMQDTGGRMEAYQRMLEEEPNMLGFKQHLQAIEQIYRNTKDRKVKPKDLETKTLIDDESQVH